MAPERHTQHRGQNPQGSTDKRAPPGCMDYLTVLARFTQPYVGTFQNALGRHRPMMLSAQTWAVTVGPRRFHKHASQMSIAGLGNSSTACLARSAAGMLTWNRTAV